MPYIPKEIREIIDDMIDEITKSDFLRDAGVLNYMISQMCRAALGENPRYKDYNRVIGVLFCAEQEFYRRAVVPYEDKKKKENGDIYE